MTDAHRKGCFDGHILDGIPRQHRRSTVYDGASNAFLTVPESVLPASGRVRADRVKTITQVRIDEKVGIYDLLDEVGSHALLKGVPMLLYGQLDECVVVRT